MEGQPAPAEGVAFTTPAPPAQQATEKADRVESLLSATEREALRWARLALAEEA